MKCKYCHKKSKGEYCSFQCTALDEKYNGRDRYKPKIEKSLLQALEEKDKKTLKKIDKAMESGEIVRII